VKLPKEQEAGVPWWLSQLSNCLWLRSRFRSLGIEPHRSPTSIPTPNPLLSQEPASPFPSSLARSCSLSQINKIFNNNKKNRREKEKRQRRRRRWRGKSATSQFWEDREGFTSILRPGLSLKERCIGICQPEKETHKSMREWLTGGSTNI